MHELSVGKRVVKLPARWADVAALYTGRRLLRVEAAACLVKHLGGAGTVRVLLLMACLPWWRWRWVKRLPGEDVVNLTQWAVDESVQVTSTRIWWRWRWWGIPRLDFANVSMIEWDFGHRAYRQAWKSAEDGPILAFLGQVVRPLRPKRERLGAKFDGDDRVPYNGWAAERYAKALKGLPATLVALVLEVWTEGYSQQVKRYPGLFSEKTGGRVAEPLEIIHSVARDGTFGPVEAVERMSAEQVLLYMRQHLDQIKREREAYERERAKN